MNPSKIADYTSRKSYQQNYAKENREAINARKRAWRAKKKAVRNGLTPRQLFDQSRLSQ